MMIIVIFIVNDTNDSDNSKVNANAPQARAVAKMC